MNRKASRTGVSSNVVWIFESAKGRLAYCVHRTIDLGMPIAVLCQNL